MRARSIVVATASAIAAAAAATLAYDRLAARDFAYADGEHVEHLGRGLRILCRHHPLTAETWRLAWDPPEGTGWEALLPRRGDPVPFAAPDGSLAIDARWVAIALDPRQRRCSGAALDGGEDALDDPDFLELPPDDVESPGITLAERRARYWAPEPDAGPPGRRPLHPREALLSGHEHGGLRVRGGLPAVAGAGVCLAERDVGLRFCVETETVAVEGRAVVGDGPYLEILDLAPRVLTARDTRDGHLVWRTEVPTDASEVWLVRGPDGGVGLRANEDYFAPDLESGALVRVTPEDAQLCDVGYLVSVGGGAVATTPRSPALLTVRARPGPAQLSDCIRGAREGTTLAAVVADAPATGDPAPPTPIADVDAPLAGGSAVYVLGADGRVEAAWALPWARDVVDLDGRLVARTGGDDVALVETDAGLALVGAAPP